MDSSDPERRRSRHRATTVEAVQDAALSMMQRRGFDGVTVAAIAREAGVSPSTVYRHFGTKEALVLSGDGIDEVIPAVVAASGTDRSSDGPQLVGDTIATVLAELDQARLGRRLRLVFAHPGLATAFEHRLLALRHELADVLAERRGASGGRLRDHATAGAILGLLVSVLDRWQSSGGEKSLVKSWRKAFRVVF